MTDCRFSSSLYLYFAIVRFHCACGKFCSKDYTEVSFCVTALRLGCASGVLSKQVQFIESHHTPLHIERKDWVTLCI